MQSNEFRTLSELLSPSAIKLLSASGSELVQQIGLDVVRGVVLDVFSGKNLRDSTEQLTRRRIAALNLATVELFLKGSTASQDFVANLPDLAAEILSQKQQVPLADFIGLSNNFAPHYVREAGVEYGVESQLEPETDASL
jgi:hypothetical protein